MSDLIDRSQRVLAVDSSLPKWQRLEEMLETFSGLELSGLDDDVRAEFEDGLSGLNLVLSRYDLQAGDDYSSLSDADLDAALAAVTGTAQQAIDNELVRILVDFDDHGRKLPVAAIEETRRHRELMIPKLIEAIREAAAEAQEGLLEGNAHFFAMFLLSEFQSEAGFQAILEAVSLPGELPFELFGDCLTEVLARILAQFCGDRQETLDDLIANRLLNEYVRWEAAQTYIYLIRDGRMQYGDAVQRLRDHLQRALDQDDFEIVTPLICELTKLGAQDALEEVREAFENGVVETFMIDYEGAKAGLVRGHTELKKSLDRCPPTGIADTIAELRTWASFREEEERKPPPAPRRSSNLDLGDAFPFESNRTTETGRRVGRNEPCPCGSGKKYKNCCMRAS